MKKPAAILCGLAAIAPFASMFVVPLMFQGPHPATYDAIKAESEQFSRVVYAVILASYSTIGAFMLHAWRSNRVPKEKRGLWVALLFFGNMFTLPLYWFWYMWRPTLRAQPTAPTDASKRAAQS
jgi:hypothetical protein